MKDGEAEIAENQNVHLARMLKVAVATAIVKTKPRHLTAEQYTQDLCNKFALSQLSWRSKYECVETELLHAKQELALRELHTESTQSSQQDAPAFLLTPPPSLEETLPTNQTPNVPKRDLELHTKFLQGVAQLKSISSGSAGEAHISSITKLTILKSVSSIQDAIGLPANECIPYKYLIHATQIVAKVCSGLQQGAWDEIKDSIDQLLNAIITDLFTQDAPEEYSVQDQLCEMFLHLAGLERLQKASLDILLTKIEEFSGHLRDVSADKIDLDPVMFENMFFVLSLTEMLLTRIKTTNSNLKGAFYQRFSDRLDDALLHFTDQFPLFGRFLWTIGCLFMNESDVPRIAEGGIL